MVQWLYFVAIDRLPVGIALLLKFTAPVLVALYTRVVRREDVRRRTWIAIGLAFSGLALVAQVWRDSGLDRSASRPGWPQRPASRPTSWLARAPPPAATRHH